MKANAFSQTRNRSILSDEQFVAKCLDIIEVPIFIIQPNQSVFWVNSKGCEILGLSCNSILGKNWFDSFIPERIRETLRIDFIFFLEGNSHTFEFCTYPVLLPSGEEKGIAWRNALLRNDDGSITSVVFSGKDLTENEKLEKQIQAFEQQTVTLPKRAIQLDVEQAPCATEQRYRTLIENLPQRIFHKDKNSVYVSCNRNYARDLGIEPEDIVGKTDFDFFPVELAEKYRADDRRVMETGSTEDIEEVYTRRGRQLFVHTVKTPIRDETGTVIGVLGIFGDVTQQRLAEQRANQLTEDLKRRSAELELANQELEAFAYSVSHDLRAPLRSIEGFVQMLAEDCSESLNDTALYYISRIRSATSRMNMLIGDILRLSHITRVDITREKVDISRIAHDIACDLRSTDPSRDTEFKISDGLVSYADSKLVRILLENLLSNSWKFTSRRKHAIIKLGITSNNDEQPVFFIQDNGVGFDMDQAKGLFSPFQRLHPMEEFPGVGLGLTIAERIVRKHGGRIWAEASVGDGATFYFTL